jgi:hypothetical protein
MKTGLPSCAVILAAVLSLTAAGLAQAPPGEAFVGAQPAGSLDSPHSTGVADGMVFAEGTRAINEGRWSDAIAIFAKIAEQKSDHADGALYWKAYAENKLGQSAHALETCSALRAGYAKSSWGDECGALEIEIRAKNGQPVPAKAEQTDELKLLALNSLMQRNEVEGRARLEEIVNDEDSSPRLKEGAQFLLGQQHTGVSYAQIVRISHVEGDVRISRGKESEKVSGATWEKATADVPLESGYNLVTGAGRAEIELEDASTFYVGENSVLSFNDLHTIDGVPYTELALLSGTVSLHVHPYVPGEMFILRTPTDDDLFVQYPNHSFLRVTSYTDATAITPLVSGLFGLPGGSQQAVVGQTMYFHEHHRIDAPASADDQEFAAFDKWAADRAAERKEAMTSVMSAAGLNSPLPGLADMQGHGTFFDCAPYGTCWEPTGVNDSAVAENRQPATQAPTALAPAQPLADVAEHAVASTQAPDTSDSAAAQPRVHGPIKFIPGPNGANSRQSGSAFDDDFPCTPQSVLYRWMRDPFTGQARFVGSAYDPYSYDWARCHSGYWIHRGNHYAWVVGKRHHHEPVHWIKSGKTVAYVPIHPKDVKGELPVNAKHEVFAVHDKNGVTVERMGLGADRPIEQLKEPPREFRTSAPLPLARAEEPRLEAHSLRESPASKGVMAKAGTPITFDHKTQSFVMARQEMHGSRSVTVVAPISNHGGNLQSHSAGAGGSQGGGVNGGSHGGSSSASSGGGSHGGGGSSGSSASSGSSGSSGGASGGGGGSHH